VQVKLAVEGAEHGYGQIGGDSGGHLAAWLGRRIWALVLFN
jgi:hypothetical protein